jgi:hypothetical protein
MASIALAGVGRGSPKPGLPGTEGEAGIVIHLAEIGIVVLDRLPEQLETSLRELTTLRLIRAGDGS